MVGLNREQFWNIDSIDFVCLSAESLRFNSVYLILERVS